LPLFYVPLRQLIPLAFDVHVKTAGSVGTIGSVIVRQIRALDPNLASYEVLSMREQVARATATQRIAVTFLTLFAALALCLAALGLYGVMSYVVSQSTRELSVRMALGAAPWDVLRVVLARGLVLTACGLVAGVVIALGTTRLLGDLLYQTSPRDPMTFASALLVMLAASLAACLVPAWRAARTDVAHALRV
jgi:ABC-type antimicrobial peptide transport system permease subunit